eukprot:g19877.t1
MSRTTESCPILIVPTLHSSDCSSFLEEKSYVRVSVGLCPSLPLRAFHAFASDQDKSSPTTECCTCGAVPHAWLTCPQHQLLSQKSRNQQTAPPAAQLTFGTSKNVRNHRLLRTEPTFWRLRPLLAGVLNPKQLKSLTNARTEQLRPSTAGLLPPSSSLKHSSSSEPTQTKHHQGSITRCKITRPI